MATHYQAPRSAHRVLAMNCAAAWAWLFLHFTNFHPSPQRQQGASAFWTAREGVARGFPPAPPCSERLNSPPVVISWLTIPELLDKHINRHHSANKILFFPWTPMGRNFLPLRQILISESTLCWDLSLVLVLTEPCLLPFIHRQYLQKNTLCHYFLKKSIIYSQTFFPILCCISYDDKIPVVCDSFLLWEKKMKLNEGQTGLQKTELCLWREQKYLTRLPYPFFSGDTTFHPHVPGSWGVSAFTMTKAQIMSSLFKWSLATHMRD